MSTAVVTPAIAQPQPASSSFRERALSLALITILTGLALVVHGYHPWSEDGGLYAAGIKRLLHPALYPHSLPFVEAHLRFSLFAPGIAAVVCHTRISLDSVLLLIHLASIWTTLFAVWLLAQRCYASRTAHAGAVCLAAATLTVPVAGTSLILMDPYVTARSISLPCGLLALALTVDLMRPATANKRLKVLAILVALLLLAALAHPLMAAYALADILLFAALLSRHGVFRRWGTVGLCLSALTLAGILQAAAHPDTVAYTRVAITRYYWFLSQWQSYEIVGLIAPLLILGVVAFQRRPTSGNRPAPLQALATMAVASGLTAIAISLCFAHESSASHIVSRFQPLRAFQAIYITMVLILGAMLGERLLRRKIWRWIAAFMLFGGIFFYAQRSTYPSSAHIEWPGAAPRNHWEQAFVWIIRNTPADALFAMDANYISLPGEDAQSFRAIAERSSLPDYSKDGGEASITPALTDAWTISQKVQTHLSSKTDAERLIALRPFAVNWIVLQQQAKTSFDCPYQNALVKVCRLP